MMAQESLLEVYSFCQKKYLINSKLTTNFGGKIMFRNCLLYHLNKIHIYLGFPFMIQVGNRNGIDKLDAVSTHFHYCRQCSSSRFLRQPPPFCNNIGLGGRSLMTSTVFSDILTSPFPHVITFLQLFVINFSSICKGNSILVAPSWVFLSLKNSNNKQITAQQYFQFLLTHFHSLKKRTSFMDDPSFKLAMKGGSG